jgi:hypothetical protein
MIPGLVSSSRSEKQRKNIFFMSGKLLNVTVVKDSVLGTVMLANQHIAAGNAARRSGGWHV